MEILYKRSINRWDKDSFRPGPVGSVGEVITAVKLKHSAPDLPERYDSTFSGKNQSWSGSNVSDGMWNGWTSGGRSAVIVRSDFTTHQQKSNVGWVMQNIMPVDRTTEPKMTSLGRYGWDTTVGSILKAKVTGEQFLPAPGEYTPSSLTRGAHAPRIVSTSIGEDPILPAADVKITDPIFGEGGYIETIKEGCTYNDTVKDEYGHVPIWAPAMDDPRRTNLDDYFRSHYPWRESPKSRVPTWVQGYPPISDRVVAYYEPSGEYFQRKFSPCASLNRPPNEPPNKPREVNRRPVEGDPRRKAEDEKKKREDEKKKKQKMS